jgi:hypothetical protein
LHLVKKGLVAGGSKRSVAIGRAANRQRFSGPQNKEKPPGGMSSDQSVGTAPGADQAAPRIARSEEDVPATFGGLAWTDPINAFATSRTKPNMNPPPTVPYITETDT